MAQILNDRRITQRELAERCGVRPETISRIKSHQREPSPLVMLLIARALDMAVEEIFYIE